MDDDGEEESVEEGLYVRQESSSGLEEEIPTREVESDDDGADDVDEEWEYGAENPGGEDVSTPESRSYGDIFEVEDIFDESESESDENWEEDSFFDRVDRGEWAPENREMFARFFDDPDDEIIKKYEFERSEDDPTDRDSSTREGIIPESERENDCMKQREEENKEEENESIFDIYTSSFPDIHKEKSEWKNPNNTRDTKEGEDCGKGELKEILSMDEEGKDIPGGERKIRENIAHKENGHDREGSREDPDRETTSIELRVIHVRKYIPPEEYGQKSNERNDDNRNKLHNGTLFFAKYFVFAEGETLSLSVFKGSREEEDIHPDEDEKYPNKPRDELWYGDHDDTKEDKNNTDEIHRLKNYGIKNIPTV